MRVKLFTFLCASAVTAGMAALAAAALFASAFAANGDASFGVRGSLGASLGDLSLDTGGGAWAFVLNAGFALACFVAAHRMTRGDSQRPGSPRRCFTAVGRLSTSFG